MNFKLAVAICLGVLGSVAMASDSVAEVADVRSELMHSVVSADGFENNPYFTNDPSKDEEFFANAASRAAKAFDKNPTCSGISAATDIYILDTSKSNLWCAYNDSIILKMSNTATNQGLDICKWRYITCTGGISVVYTLIYQGISGTTKYLYCQTTGSYDFCGKMVLANPLEDWGQFWLRTSTYGIDTLKANTINKYAADITGFLGTNINAQYFKTCEQAYINTC